ncbi:MAG: flagellar basal-body rod protein FlgG [Gammaproteobacteria bacterium]|jgi:flagellar basal-body rod protein FlgG
MRTAASGMLAQQTQVDTIANNIANVNTAAFKSNRVNFQSLLYTTTKEPGAATAADNRSPTGLQIGSGTDVAGSIKLHTQGELELTGNSLDIAIQGDGFFKVDIGNGEQRYTRDGSFRRDANGDMVTVDGFRFDQNINIPDDVTSVTIGQDGTVEGTVPGQSTATKIGNISLYRFPNPAGMSAEGQNMYSATPGSGAEAEQTPGQTGAGFIRQGFLERSNVSVVNELINLIQAQRNYEVNSRTISVSDEMLQQVSQLV